MNPAWLAPLADAGDSVVGGPGWLACLALVASLALILSVAGRRPAAPQPAPARPADAPAVPTPADEALPPELVAVIAAAVSASFDAPVRIAAVQPVGPGAGSEIFMQLWSVEGRRQIYSSHQTR